MTKLTEQMKVSVVGDGAVGRVLACLIARHGVSCSLLSRQGPVLPSCTVDLGCGPATYALSEHEKPDIWFFVTKAYDLSAALEQWRPDTTAVVLCNGDVSKAIPAKPAIWRRGVVTFGVKEKGDHFAIQGDDGSVTWGGDGPNEVEQRLLDLEPRFRWTDHPDVLWQQKWLLNVVINTIAAAYRLRRNGDILQHHAELLAVCAGEAWRFAKLRWPSLSWSEPDFRQRIDEVIRDTANNENSMARDRRQGRRTEVDYLAGLVDAKSCPQLAELTRQILANGS